MTATIAIPTPARVRFPRVWTGGRCYVPSSVRHFFDLLQIRIETRCQARQNVRKLLPVVASFRCLRHAQRLAWRDRSGETEQGWKVRPNG